MSMYPNWLQPALQNLLQRVVQFFHPRSSRMTHISADVFGGQKSLVKPVTWQKTCNYIKLFSSSTWDCHISADVQRITLNASCMTISGERTKQLNIFCRVTGFTSDFLSFIVVEFIRFFHGAFQLIYSISETKLFEFNKKGTTRKQLSQHWSTLQKDKHEWIKIQKTS